MATKTFGGITYGWANHESGWGTGMNENLLRLGAFRNGAVVKGIGASDAPASPEAGDVYALARYPAAQVWQNQGGSLALWDGAAWVFWKPAAGHRVAMLLDAIATGGQRAEWFEFDGDRRWLSANQMPFNDDGSPSPSVNYPWLAPYITRHMNNSGTTLNIGPVASMASVPPIGGKIRGIQADVGPVTFTAQNGVTLNVPANSNAKTAGQFCAYELTYAGNDVWYLSGALESNSTGGGSSGGGTTAPTKPSLFDVVDNREFAATDVGAYLMVLPAEGTTLTLPADGFSMGDIITGVQRNAGQVTIVAASGVRLNVPVGHNAKTRGKFSAFSLILTPHGWDLTGDLEVAP